MANKMALKTPEWMPAPKNPIKLDPMKESEMETRRNWEVFQKWKNDSKNDSKDSKKDSKKGSKKGSKKKSKKKKNHFGLFHKPKPKPKPKRPKGLADLDLDRSRYIRHGKDVLKTVGKMAIPRLPKAGKDAYSWWAVTVLPASLGLLALLKHGKPKESNDTFTADLDNSTAYEDAYAPDAMVQVYHKYDAPIPKYLEEFENNHFSVEGVPTPFDDRYLCPITIGGDQTLNMLLDTGSSLS